jgi:CARDB
MIQSQIFSCLIRSMFFLVLSIAISGTVYGQEKELYEEHPAWSMPDLAIGQVSMDPERAEPGNTIRLSVVVTNQGPGKASATKLHIKVLGDRAASVDVPSLSSGESARLTAIWVASRPGIFPVSVEVAPAGEVPERSLDNNKAYIKMRVKGELDMPPELEVVWEGMDDLQISAGNDFEPEFTISNIGLVASPETSLHIYHNGEKMDRLIVPELQPGDKKAIRTRKLRAKKDGNLIIVRIRLRTDHPLVWSWFIQVPADTQTILNSSIVGWVPIGPRLIKPDDWTGRMTCFAFHPTDSSTIYAGGMGHKQNGPGLWKSTNGGKKWVPLTDRLESMSVSSVAIDPLHPKHIYFGTGKHKPAGIFKSLDGGKNWHKYVVRSAIGNAKIIKRLMVTPKTGQELLLYAATDKGVYRHTITNPSMTTSSKKEWEKIKSGNVIDMAPSPTDSQILFASVKGKGLYRTKSAASVSGDADWTPLTKGLPASTSDQFLYFDIHRTKPNLLFMSLYKPTINHVLGIYRSDTGGDAWSKVELFKSGDLSEHPYNPFLRISPTDPPYIYFGGVRLYRAHELPAGGLQVKEISGAAYDLKALEFDPADSKRYFSLGDQGVFEGRVVAQADIITPRNNELQVTQFFDIDASQVTPGKIIGGTQDTGTLLMAPGLSPPDWKMIRGGDGYHSLILPPNGSGVEVFFSQHQFISQTWWTDLGLAAHQNGWKTNLTGAPPDTDASGNSKHYLGKAWITKHPDNPNRVFSQGKVVHAVNGPQFSKWDKLGPAGKAVLGEVHRVLVQPGTNLLVAGMTSGQIWASSSGGAVGTWDLIFDRAFDPADVRSMAFSVANPRVLFVLYSKGTRKDMRVVSLEHSVTSKIWNATGYMGAELPDNVNLNVISGDGYDPDVAYIGTSTGVFRCDNTKPLGKICEPYNKGLPLTAVSDLLVEPTTRSLIGATMARGAWMAVTAPTSSADLVPVKWNPDIDGPVSYCKRVEDKLHVRIRNQGDRKGICHVLIEFAHGKTRFLNLGIIQAGQETTGSVVIPAPIPAGDINFKIRIIPDQAETNLENNVIDGRCIG